VDELLRNTQWLVSMIGLRVQHVQKEGKCGSAAWQHEDKGGRETMFKSYATCSKEAGDCLAAC